MLVQERSYATARLVDVAGVWLPRAFGLESRLVPK